MLTDGHTSQADEEDDVIPATPSDSEAEAGAPSEYVPIETFEAPLMGGDQLELLPWQKGIPFWQVWQRQPRQLHHNQQARQMEREAQRRCLRKHAEEERQRKQQRQHQGHLQMLLATNDASIICQHLTQDLSKDLPTIHQPKQPMLLCRSDQIQLQQSRSSLEQPGLPKEGPAMAAAPFHLHEGLQSSQCRVNMPFGHGRSDEPMEDIGGCSNKQPEMATVQTVQVEKGDVHGFSDMDTLKGIAHQKLDLGDYSHDMVDLGSRRKRENERDEGTRRRHKREPQPNQPQQQQGTPRGDIQPSLTGSEQQGSGENSGQERGCKIFKLPATVPFDLPRGAAAGTATPPTQALLTVPCHAGNDVSPPVSWVADSQVIAVPDSQGRGVGHFSKSRCESQQGKIGDEEGQGAGWQGCIYVHQDLQDLQQQQQQQQQEEAEGNHHQSRQQQHQQKQMMHGVDVEEEVIFTADADVQESQLIAELIAVEQYEEQQRLQHQQQHGQQHQQQQAPSQGIANLPGSDDKALPWYKGQDDSTKTTANTGFSRANGRSLAVHPTSLARFEHLFCDEQDKELETMEIPTASTTGTQAHRARQKVQPLQGQPQKLWGAFKPQAPSWEKGQLPPAAARLLDQRKDLMQKRKM